MICPDTNILLRAFVQPANAEDERQARIAQDLLLGADKMAVSLAAFCEMAWVLRSVYRISAQDIATTIRHVAESANVVCDMTSVELGVRVLLAGGDFADGAIAGAGTLAGAPHFVSFDRRAVARLVALGHDATVPA